MRRQLQSQELGSDAANAVRVALRVRPMLSAEHARGETVNATAMPDGRTLLVTSQLSHGRQVEAQQHRFDMVFGPDVSQRALFHQLGVEALCDSVLEGFAATVFAFGMSSSGKSYTMTGPAVADPLDGTGGNGSDLAGTNGSLEAVTEVTGDHAGLQVRAAFYMAATAAELNRLAALESDGNGNGGQQHRAVTLKATYYEVYNEHVNDLLNDRAGLRCRWSQAAQAFFVEHLMVVQCDAVDDLAAVLAEGNANRKRAAHRLNVDSSRSHVVFTVYAERRDAPGAPPRLGKVNFVDLAGSERLRDSESSGIHEGETKAINKSLLALGNVIQALAKGSAPFVPYRDSTLTKLLMDSLGGNCRTLMVACITPSSRFTEESLRTVGYAHRTRNIVNSHPAVRLDPGQQQLFEMRLELEMLRRENAALRLQVSRGGGGNDAAPPPLPPPRSLSPSSLSLLAVATQPQQQPPLPRLAVQHAAAVSRAPSMTSVASTSRSLPALSSPPPPPPSSAPQPRARGGGDHQSPSSSSALVELEAVDRTRRDNDDLRREVAQLREMVMALRAAAPAQERQFSPSATTTNNSSFAPAAGSAVAATPLFSQAAGRGRPALLQPMSDFDQRSGGGGAVASSALLPPPAPPHEYTASLPEAPRRQSPPPPPPPPAPSSLTDFGFRPAPKRTQRLLFGT